MRAANRSTRPGYTLLEIMCVMAILVIVSAVSVPVIQSMLVDARMTAAGDMVRARLADTRAKAMDEGRSWRLGFLPGSSTFQLAPDDSTEWDTTSQDTIRLQDLIRDELPRDIVLALNQADIEGASGTAAPAGKWETVAVYKWDGSAMDDTTTYFGKAGMTPMRVNVRSLTGAVSIEVPMLVKAGQP
jgi:prepilin-type N-terminal cleavage/methylation domain-containing protein